MKKLLIGLLALGSFSVFASRVTHTAILEWGEVGYAVSTKGNLRFSCGPNPDSAFPKTKELEIGEKVKVKIGFDMFSYDEQGNPVRLVKGDRLIFKCQ